MKKTFMLIALSGIISCASLFAMDEDFKAEYPNDEDETSYQNYSEEDFKIGEEESEQSEGEGVSCGDCEKIGYIDDDPGQKVGYIDDQPGE